MNLKAFKYEWKQSKIKRAICRDLENLTQYIDCDFAKKCVISSVSVPHNNSIHFIDNRLQPDVWKET